MFKASLQTLLHKLIFLLCESLPTVWDLPSHPSFPSLAYIPAWDDTITLTTLWVMLTTVTHALTPTSNRHPRTCITEPHLLRLELEAFSDKLSVGEISILRAPHYTAMKNGSNAIYLQMKQKQSFIDGPGNLTPASMGKCILSAQQ